MRKQIFNNLNKDDLMIVSDLDGTLLNDDSYLSDYSYNVLKNYGGFFAIATGRSYSSAKKVLYNLTFPMVTNDGACIYNSSGELLYCNIVNVENLIPLIDNIIKDMAIMVFCKVNGEEKIFWIGKDDKYVSKYLLSRLGDKRFVHVNDKGDLFRGDVFLINFLNSYKKIKNLKYFLESNGVNNIFVIEDAYNKGAFWLKIRNKCATEKNSVKLLSDLFNKKYIIAIGNERNDLDMLEVSDYSVCVDNAPDYVKSVVDLVIDSNQVDGVAKFISTIN